MPIFTPTLGITLPLLSVKVTVQAEPSLYFMTRLFAVKVVGFLRTLAVTEIELELYLLSPEYVISIFFVPTDKSGIVTDTLDLAL